MNMCLEKVESSDLPRLYRLVSMSSAEPVGEDAAAVKCALGRHGINQRGWRLLLNYAEPLLSGLPEPGDLDRVAVRHAFLSLVDFIRLVQQCETDFPPPSRFAKAWIRQEVPHRPNRSPHLILHIFRQAWSHYLSRDLAGADTGPLIDRELPLVLRWASDVYRVDVLNPSRPSWQGLVRRAEDWWRRCVHRLHLDVWQTVLNKELLHDGLHVVELLSPGAIEDEARAMRHCIDGYIDDCIDGNYRVFSIQFRKTGERVATLGIGFFEDRWMLDDLKGPENSEVNGAVRSLATWVLCFANAGLARQLELFSACPAPTVLPDPAEPEVLTLEYEYQFVFLPSRFRGPDRGLRGQCKPI